MKWLKLPPLPQIRPIVRTGLHLQLLLSRVEGRPLRRVSFFCRRGSGSQSFAAAASAVIGVVFGRRLLRPVYSPQHRPKWPNKSEMPFQHRATWGALSEHVAGEEERRTCNMEKEIVAYLGIAEILKLWEGWICLRD